MTDRLTNYKRGDQPIAGPNELWPLYGAGLENLGVDRKPIEAPMPQFGPNELLVRHDACGLCFSDTKVINLGQNIPIRQEACLPQINPIGALAKK